MTEQAIHDTAFITGTILIFYYAPAAGSKHTILVKIFVDRIGVKLDDLGYELAVSTPVIGVGLTTGVREGHCHRGTAVHLISRYHSVADERVRCYHGCAEIYSPTA